MEDVVEPGAASSQPASAPRSAAKKASRRRVDLAADRGAHLRLAGEVPNGRPTVCPRRRSSITYQLPRKPAPPVTRTVLSLEPGDAVSL